MASQYSSARIDLSSRWLVGILLLAILVTFVNLGRLPLFDEDEGEYAQVAVEMANSGNFITPTLNGQPFFEKPILTFWLQAPLVQAFGVHAGLFRLPSALACLGWILLLVQFGRRFFGEEAGWLAGVLCATSLGVVVSGHAGAMDGVLSLLVAAAGFDIYRAWVDQSRWAQWRVYLWMALGLLAKGPVAVIIPFLMSGLFYASQRDFDRWLKALINPLGWLTFLIIALPWYVAQYHAMGQPFLDYFLFRENLGRMLGSLQGHGGRNLIDLNEDGVECGVLPDKLAPAWQLFQAWSAGEAPKMHDHRLLIPAADQCLPVAWIVGADIECVSRDGTQQQAEHRTYTGRQSLQAQAREGGTVRQYIEERMHNY